MAETGGSNRRSITLDRARYSENLVTGVGWRVQKWVRRLQIRLRRAVAHEPDARSTRAPGARHVAPVARSIATLPVVACRRRQRRRRRAGRRTSRPMDGKDSNRQPQRTRAVLSAVDAG